MSSRLAIALLGGLALALGSARPARAGVKDDLAAGKILAVSVPGSGIWPGRAMGVVEGPANRVFQIVTDLASYSRFVPRVEKSIVLEPGRLFELVAKLPWPVDRVRATLRIQTWQRGSTYTARWKMVDGTLERYDGSAWVQPWGKGRSLVVYEMMVVPRVPAPEALITRGLRNAVREMVRAIRDRVGHRVAQR